MTNSKPTKWQLPLALSLIASLYSCSTPVTQVSSHHHSDESRSIAAASKKGILFPADATFKLSDYTGTTYASFMRDEVKPTLDAYSDEKNAGGGGWENLGSANYMAATAFLEKKTYSSYRGAKWNRSTRSYEGGLSDEEVMKVYDKLLEIRPVSTVDSLTYYVDKKIDPNWCQKNDMCVATKESKIGGNPFDLATLYALTGGLGVKVKINENNYNYHVLYKTGHTKPHEEVMSGRSFASSPDRGVADATDPEYLRDLSKYLSETEDLKPFYKAMILALASCDPSGWANLSNLGQAVLSDFLTVYTAEADRHLMVDLKKGQHPWEIDLAAVTMVSAVSVKLGKVVQGGELKEDDIGKWFAPSPNNKEDGPQRSGIGITRNDRKLFQRAIHSYEMTTKEGKRLITDIQKIIGVKENKFDVIQGIFEYLSNPNTPDSMGDRAGVLADLAAQFIEKAVADSAQIEETFKNM